MMHKNNEYAYRILLEFDRALSDIPENLKDAFKVRADEYEYVNGPIKLVDYNIVSVGRPAPGEVSRSISLDDLSGNGVLNFNGTLQLQPLDGGDN